LFHMVDNENTNESISTFLDFIKNKFNNWFDDRIFEFLINRKKIFYLDIIDKLNMFDLSNLDDVVKAFNGLKIKSMYLAGGMDESEDTGKGWREKLENEFEFEHPGKTNDNVFEIEINNKKIIPAYTVDGIFLDMVLRDKKYLKYYDKPALFNPVRKEVDRNVDDQFNISYDQMKKSDFDPSLNDKPFNYFKKTFTENIEPDDENLLRMSDVIFLGYDKTAGAGTYAELEIASLFRKPIFTWLVNGYDNDFSKFKLWNIPHLSKIARNENEMKLLVKTILRYT